MGSLLITMKMESFYELLIGTIYKEGLYENGKKHGEYKRCCEDGRLKERFNYIFGDVVENFFDHEYEWCDK